MNSEKPEKKPWKKWMTDEMWMLVAGCNKVRSHTHLMDPSCEALLPMVCVVVVVSAAEMCATEDPGELSVSLLYCFALAVLLNNFFFRLITSVLKPLNISLASQAQ